MQIGSAYGNEHLDLEVSERSLVGVSRPEATPNLADPAAAVAAALESPLGYPALRRALTPDDHVAIVVDEQLPQVGSLLTAVLEHVAAAHVRPEAITLVCPPPGTGQPWLEELPDAFQDVHIEVHDPADRQRLAYLATTRQGRRIYLNRTVVDADQVVLLTGRGYDTLLGYAGGAGALYPALSDEATRDQAGSQLTMEAPGPEPWPLRREANEVAWLLGAPFLVQTIAGAGAGLSHVLAGPVESGAEGQRLLDARWRLEVDRPANVVVTAVSGDPARQGFTDLAHALACAARVVRPNGHIVLLSTGAPELGEAAGVLRRTDEAVQAVQAVRQIPKAADQEPAFAWACAAEQAHLYLLSKLPDDTAEELFAVPLEHASQVQRLVSGAGSCLFLPDAHHSLAVLKR
jgi:nickel-dependent lactate racemase